MIRSQENSRTVATLNLARSFKSNSPPAAGSAVSSRRGAVTIVALLVLLVLAGMIGQYVRRVVMVRRQFRQEMLHQQAEKLADAGLQLAKAARQKDAAWSGLQWDVPPGEIHQTNSGAVVISMQGDICTVVARYPNNSPLPFQVTRTRKLTP